VAWFGQGNLYCVLNHYLQPRLPLLYTHSHARSTTLFLPTPCSAHLCARYTTSPHAAAFCMIFHALSRVSFYQCISGLVSHTTTHGTFYSPVSPLYLLYNILLLVTFIFHGRNMWVSWTMAYSVSYSLLVVPCLLLYALGLCVCFHEHLTLRLALGIRL